MAKLERTAKQDRGEIAPPPQKGSVAQQCTDAPDANGANQKPDQEIDIAA